MNYQTIKTSLLLAMLILGSICLSAQTYNLSNTPGEVTFTVKTVTNNGNFAPRHVLAIWAEDNQGFVKTRKLRANQRKQYLYTWRSVSGDNVIDAVTGATLTSHQTHTISWDCTDVEGNVVPDGEYTIYIEFTEQHAQGPITGITFTKGAEEQHLTPADENNFIEMMLDFIPETTGIQNSAENNLKAFPNPGNGLFTIDLSTVSDFSLDVYNSNGKLLLHNENISASENYKLDLREFNSGIYFVEISTIEKVNYLKLIKQ